MDATAKTLLTVVVGGLAFLGIIGALGALWVYWAFGDVAPYQFDLPGSTWTVESVDGEELTQSRPRLELDDGGESATLKFECGDVPLDWHWDSDGNAIFFTHTGVSDPECPGGEVEREVFIRLISTEEWRASGDRSIDIIGPGDGTVRLTLTD